jgi:glycosyltransferase involved in cell wall biosynthesis
MHLPIRIVAAVGESVDLGPHVLTVRCDQMAGAAWPLLARVARYRLLARSLPAGTRRIVLRMPGCADASLAWYLQHLGSRTISEHHGDEIAERLRAVRGPWGMARTAAEALGLRALLRGVAGSLGVTPEIAHLLARRGPPGLRTAYTGNGIDVANVPATGCRRYAGGTLELVAVLGNAAPWHGIDRLIDGMAHCHGASIRLHLVGDLPDPGRSTPAPGMEIIRHGRLAGSALDTVLASAHLGIASLAMHRAGLVQACPLKSREYAARGLPFVYAYDDPGIPTDLPWCLRLPSGEGPVALASIIAFAGGLDRQAAQHLRAYAEQHLDWQTVLTRIHHLAVEMAG